MSRRKVSATGEGEYIIELLHLVIKFKLSIHVCTLFDVVMAEEEEEYLGTNRRWQGLHSSWMLSLTTCFTRRKISTTVKQSTGAVGWWEGARHPMTSLRM